MFNQTGPDPNDDLKPWPLAFTIFGLGLFLTFIYAVASTIFK